MILPSKKVLSVFIVVAALVTSIIMVLERDKASKIISLAESLVVGKEIKLPENPQWQEELRNIVPQSEPVEMETLAGQETTTDAISQSLMSNYLALKQTGSLDNASAQKLIEQTLEYLEKTGNGPVKITELYLNVVADNGKQSIADYGEALGDVFRDNRPAQGKNELEIISQAAQSKDPSKIKELDGIIAVYENVAEELAVMPVPKTFVKAHLDMVNGIRGIVWSLKESKALLDDPLRAMSALQLYNQNVTLFGQAFTATTVFVNQNVVYKQGSGGYYLLHGL